MSSWLDTGPSFTPTVADSLLSYNLAQLGASGNVWFVSLAGNDANSGESWDDAFRTIIYAVSVALPGDKIIVGTGTYDETANGAAGIVIAQPFIWIEGVGNVFVQNTNTDNNGVVIHFAPTTIGSVMQNFAVRKGEAVSANSVCVLMDAFFCGVNDTSILLEAGATTHAGIKLTSNASLCQITGKPDVLRAIVGLGGVGTGILFDGAINNAVDSMILAQLTTGLLFTGASLINGTTQNINITGCNIGIQLDAGVLGNVIGARFTNCVVDVLDNSGNGTNERTSVSLVTPGAHEDMYPVHLGQGVAASPVTITNTATDDTPDSRDDQDYWGDTIAVIAPGVITGRWISNGIELFAGVANKIMRMEFYYPQPGFSTTRNGGNLWDLGETVLTVTNGAIIQNGDKIWITSTSDPNGEILLVTNVAGNVITVASETRASGNTGIRYNHAGAETMYVIERSGLNRIDGHQSAYSAASTKASARQLWSVPKDLPPNTAMIGRILNIDDNLAASIQVNVVYGD